MKDLIIKNRIAEFRKEKGLSQNSLAKSVGLKRRSIMAYENHTISPTLETAYKICKVLGKDIKEVFLLDEVIEGEENGTFHGE
ncbi:MAG: helix-turn-helix transcriptional regulator [Peptoniphilaceae bacterium]|nr:helix-turn-helix transcriptional regulator [Peptoniphilaceae bacterium]